MHSEKETETVDGTMAREENAKEASTSEDTYSSDAKVEPADSHLEEPESEYPSGLLLVPIISALILTVFLIALDQVSNCPLPYHV
jgi:hypothetical protein